MSGLKRAILYGLKPHDLGFCGPKEKATKLLLDFVLKNNVSEKKIKKILREFVGAYAYYQLIARKNGIKDPFDERVIEAYWLGNELLDRVDGLALKRLVEESFSGQGLLPKAVARVRASRIPRGAVPHHSFHVFIIGSVSGRVTLSGAMLDLCRVGWGKVRRFKISDPSATANAGQASSGQVLRLKNEKEKIVVEYQSLVGEKKLKLGKPVKKEIVWNQKLLPGLKKGDWVSFHWGQAIEKLSPREIKSLEKYTRKNLEAMNK